MAYIYPLTASRYYRRHRTYDMVDGSKKRVLTTRYTYGTFKKPAKGPRGGKAYKECARSVYYADGIFYRAANIAIEPDTYDESTPKELQKKTFINSIVPYEGNIWDIHADQSKEQGIPVVMIECVEGVPVSVKCDGASIWEFGDDIKELEATLKIYSDKPAIEEAEQAITSDEKTSTETASEKSIAHQTQKAIEEHTTQGEQITLDLWAMCIDNAVSKAA